jgi:ParB-like chromosome segregation protein Spo0J
MTVQSIRQAESKGLKFQENKMRTTKTTTENYEADLAAGFSSSQVAINPKAKCALEENDGSGAVSATPLPEAYPIDQNGYCEKTLIPEEAADNPPITGVVELLDIHRLQPNPLSDSIYGNEVPESLVQSIMDNGISQPLVVCKPNLKLISGNTRLRVAKQLGVRQVPVLFLDVEFTREEEENLILAHNSARVKTNEMLVREYMSFLRIEKKLAEQRVANGRGRSERVQNFTPSKSREIAAKKVGVSYTSLEAGVKVVEAIDRLIDQGRLDDAERLRGVLEKNGYSPAKNLAAKQRWLIEYERDTEGSSKSAANPKPAPSAVLKPLPVPDSSRHQVQEAPETKQQDPLVPAERAEESDVIEKTMDTQALEAFFKGLDELEAFLNGAQVEFLSEEVKEKIGAKLAALNLAAICGGITPRMN